MDLYRFCVDLHGFCMDLHGFMLIYMHFNVFSCVFDVFMSLGWPPSVPQALFSGKNCVSRFFDYVDPGNCPI